MGYEFHENVTINDECTRAPSKRQRTTEYVTKLGFMGIMRFYIYLYIIKTFSIHDSFY